MKASNNVLQGYENTKLVRYEDAQDSLFTVAYDDLPVTDVNGVLKASWYVGGKLMQAYTAEENHVGVIAATRLGKTTSYAIPMILSFAKQKKKRGMIISDPKGELYRMTAATLMKEGYKVKLINFRDYKHSECWNLLTPIFRKYRKAVSVYDEVEVVETEAGTRNAFRGKIYESQEELDDHLERLRDMLLDEVGNDIDTVAEMLITVESQKDPYWEHSSAELLKAYLWAMLEDSDKEENPITEDTYSFSTIMSILASIRDDNSATYNDDGYFTDRGENSRAYRLVKNILLENGNITRRCILAVFNTKMAPLKDCAMRIITSCNSFDMQELIDGPTAFFINYRDELKTHYQIISLFIQDAYRYLIAQANENASGKLDVPFYFILDEFGNFPAITSFETTISACAGRNIWFVLIIQSYAQLDNVYGKSVSEIIRDNLNVHIFFGSNNPETLDAFSKECGNQTRISPLSALNGSGEEIEHYALETIPLVPKSMLAHFEPGECIITEANSGYVLFSKLERYYLCNEFKNLPQLSTRDYVCAVDPFDKRFKYVIKKRKSRNPFDDD